jgi:hypothetical protein
MHARRNYKSPPHDLRLKINYGLDAYSGLTMIRSQLVLCLRRTNPGNVCIDSCILCRPVSPLLGHKQPLQKRTAEETRETQIETSSRTAAPEAEHLQLC